MALRWPLKGIAVVCAVLAASIAALHAVAPQAHFARPFYDGCRKIWSHRTSVPNAPENSIEGLARVLAMGAPGVEIDVIYDEAQARFVVISEEAYSAGATSVLYLDNMLRVVPQSTYLWLDFWNLSRLSDKAAEVSAEQLRTLLERESLLERAIVESTDARRLGELASLGIYTSFWLEVRSDKQDMIGHVRDLLKAGITFRQARYAAVSLDYKEYSRLAALVFSNVPIHLFTVNDPVTLRRLIEDPRVKIVLTDRQDFGPRDCGAGLGARANSAISASSRPSPNVTL